MTTVGLPDSAVRESRERVRSAIRNAGFAFPSDRITVNLTPAGLRKEGASFDLPIALGILTATGSLHDGGLGPFAVVGELALDGQIQPVRGTLAVGLACRRRGIGTLLVPHDNCREASAVDGLRVLPAATLRDAVALLNGEAAPAPTSVSSMSRHVTGGARPPGKLLGAAPPRGFADGRVRLYGPDGKLVEIIEAETFRERTPFHSVWTSASKRAAARSSAINTAARIAREAAAKRRKAARRIETRKAKRAAMAS